MGKQDVIRSIAENCGLSQTQVRGVIEEFLGELSSALVLSGRFSWPKFGVFTVKVRAARAGRNPATGAPVQIPAKYVIHFKPSTPFVKEAT